MQKGDIYAMIIIVIILAGLTIFVLNIDKLFITPTVNEVLRQMMA